MWQLLRRLFENVALGADVAGQRHHHLFADRIDRRVGDLREQLLEIIEQQLRPSDRQASGVSVPMEPIGSSPFAAIGSRIISQIFFGVSEGALAAEHGLVIRCHARATAPAADPA